MKKPRSPERKPAAKAVSPLMVRLDQQSKKCLTEAAEIRQVSVSDYVRAVVVPQARREVQAAREQVITLTPEEQRQFWDALNETVEPTESQRRLGAIMRGES
jgi:uncharacterized protein (DUF1778 family)